MDYSVTYEENFLIREIGTIASKADIALTELIANAHDAGASEVRIKLPSDLKGLLTVEDNGVGLTNKEFENRWLRLRYDRRKHQGIFVDTPKDSTLVRRRLAFGRNGVGRHAGLCFNDSYTVETWTKGEVNTYDLALSVGRQPIDVINHIKNQKSGHGTIIRVHVERNLIPENILSEIISARFLFNPEFKVYINGKLISLSKHPGIVKEKEIHPVGNIKIKLTLIDSAGIARTTGQHGVAFWLGGRLLGTPSWSIQGEQVLDGRRTFARRYTLIAQSDDLFDYVEADWSGFKSDFKSIALISSEISDFVKVCYLELSKNELAQTRKFVIDSQKEAINELPVLARKELYEFIDNILAENPDIKIELLELAFKAAINLEKSRSGVLLLHKLTNISSNDIEALDQFLNEWCAVDAMEILAEIDSRIKVIEAISRLSSDHSVDELHTLHPIIEKARWVFGPEFDTPEYSSNKGLRKTMELIFKKKYKKECFNNSAKRPDIVIGENSSVSALGLEEFENNIKKTKRVLLIELKKGGFTIGRQEMDQAKHYVQDIWHAGVDSTQPIIRAFVVGDTVDNRTGTFESVGVNREQNFGEVNAITYNELVRTAEARLFLLKEKISGRYENLEQDSLLEELLSTPTQGKFKKVIGY